MALHPTSQYLQLTVLNRIFMETYSPLISFLFFNAILAIISTSFVILRGSYLPALLLILAVGGDLSVILLLHFIFSLFTSSHILSKKLVQIGKEESGSEYNSKFWAGMQPLRVGAGGTCSFETREFLLCIWLNVVMAKLIDLLIAY